MLYCLADEIDAIGKARGPMSNDPGTQEREQGLLQLLCEMDGFRTDHRVRHTGAWSALVHPLVLPGRQPAGAPLPWHTCLAWSQCPLHILWLGGGGPVGGKVACLVQALSCRQSGLPWCWPVHKPCLACEAAPGEGVWPPVILGLPTTNGVLARTALRRVAAWSRGPTLPIHA